MPQFIFLSDDGTSFILEAHCPRCFAELSINLDLFDGVSDYDGWLHQLARPIPESYHSRWLDSDETELVRAIEEGRVQ